MKRIKTTMSARVRKSYPFIRLIVKTAKVSLLLARRLLGEANAERLLSVAELIVNVLRGNLKISERVRAALSRSKKTLRKLSRIRKPDHAAKLFNKHYKTVVFFLKQCLPHLQSLFGGKPSGNYWGDESSGNSDDNSSDDYSSSCESGESDMEDDLDETSDNPPHSMSADSSAQEDSDQCDRADNAMEHDHSPAYNNNNGFRGAEAPPEAVVRNAASFTSHTPTQPAQPTQTTPMLTSTGGVQPKYILSQAGGFECHTSSRNACVPTGDHSDADTVAARECYNGNADSENSCGSENFCDSDSSERSRESGPSANSEFSEDSEDSEGSEDSDDSDASDDSDDSDDSEGAGGTGGSENSSDTETVEGASASETESEVEVEFEPEPQNHASATEPQLSTGKRHDDDVEV